MTRSMQYNQPCPHHSTANTMIISNQKREFFVELGVCIAQLPSPKAQQRFEVQMLDTVLAQQTRQSA